MEENNNKPMVVESAAKMNALSMYFEQSQFETSMRVCKMLSTSDLVPQNYQYHPVFPQPQNEAEAAANEAARGKAIANCLIALNKAATLNSDPLTIMQNMAIVHGRPTWSSSFLIATVNSCGRFKPLKYRFGQDEMLNEEFSVYKKGQTGEKRKVEMPNYTCVAYTTERGSEELLEGAEISMRMAFDEGWLTKDGSKWMTMPKQMLMYRAAAFWTRVYAPEISQGLYTKDEVNDFAEYEEVPMDAPQEAAVAEAVNVAHAEAPTFEEEAVNVAPAPEPVKEAKHKKKEATPGF